MIHKFLADAPAGAARTLQVFAVAESLTNCVAKELYAIAPVAGVSDRAFIDALRQTSFIKPRNSEWSIESGARDTLLVLPERDAGALRDAHKLLLGYTCDPDPSLAGDVIPSYLYTIGGRAYHQAGVGDVAHAITTYGDAALLNYSGAQWLAGRLADFQERTGVLPGDRSELLFLKAITLFRAGKRGEARPLIERIVAKNEETRQTAMAFNMLGNMLSKEDPIRAEALLRRGIVIDEQIGDIHGVAIGQHSLGRLIGHDRKRLKEATLLLEQSIEYGESHDNIHHAAQARHSFGHLLARFAFRSRRAEAERHLRRSYKELIITSDLTGAAKAMHTLALLVAREQPRRKEAEDLLRRSLEIGERTRDRLGVAMRTKTLGTFLAEDPERVDEAISTLRRARDLTSALGQNVSDLDERLASLAKFKSEAK